MVLRAAQLVLAWPSGLGVSFEGFFGATAGPRPLSRGAGAHLFSGSPIFRHIRAWVSFSWRHSPLGAVLAGNHRKKKKTNINNNNNNNKNNSNNNNNSNINDNHNNNNNNNNNNNDNNN